MAKKIKLTWFDLSPSIFPANVQAAVKAVHEANAKLAAKIAELPESKAQKKAIEAADALIQPFAARIQVPVNPAEPEGDKVMLVTPGTSLDIGYRWNKLSVAAKPTTKAAKSSGAVLA